jgi:hypothetical protein
MCQELIYILIIKWGTEDDKLHEFSCNLVLGLNGKIIFAFGCVVREPL